MWGILVGLGLISSRGVPGDYASTPAVMTMDITTDFHYRGSKPSVKGGLELAVINFL